MGGVVSQQIPLTNYLPAITGQGSADKCQVLTVPKPDLNFEKGGFFSPTAYSAAGWIETDNFYIAHDDMEDNGDTYSIYFNCEEKGAASVDVKEGWTAIVRMYEPNDVQGTVDYVQQLRKIPLRSAK